MLIKGIISLILFLVGLISFAEDRSGVVSPSEAQAEYTITDVRDFLGDQKSKTIHRTGLSAWTTLLEMGSRHLPYHPKNSEVKDVENGKTDVFLKRNHHKCMNILVNQHKHKKDMTLLFEFQITASYIRMTSVKYKSPETENQPQVLEGLDFRPCSLIPELINERLPQSESQPTIDIDRTTPNEEIFVEAWR